jgi:DNA-binding NtrC family response regulator
MIKVLVVDDKQMMRDSVTATLSRAGYQAIAAPDGASALEMISRHRPAAVVSDLKMPGMDGIELLAKIVELDAQIPVVLMTAYATIDTAVDAMKQGAFDYIQKPFEGDQLVLAVKRAAEHHQLKRENEVLRQTRGGQGRQHRLVGDSCVMQDLRRQIEQVAASHGTVLITGESGTGKEIVARTWSTPSARDVARRCWPSTVRR